MKNEGDGDIQLVGSTKLARTLVENDLVDGSRRMIDPVILGGGNSNLFDDGAFRKLRLVEDQVTTTGAILATCARATG